MKRKSRRIGGVNPPEPKDLRPEPTPAPPSCEAVYIATLREQLDEAQAEVRRLRAVINCDRDCVTGPELDEALAALAALTDGPEET